VDTFGSVHVLVPVIKLGQENRRVAVRLPFAAVSAFARTTITEVFYPDIEPDYRNTRKGTALRHRRLV
jgi:hypothetical protein